MPGRAAYMDGRSGSSSMRLNFAGVPDGDIREGVRRIGRAVREQLGLLGSLSGPGPATGARAKREDKATARGEPDAGLADVVALPGPREAGARRRLDR